jgi:hypothetical protein
MASSRGFNTDDRRVQFRLEPNEMICLGRLQRGDESPSNTAARLIRDVLAREENADREAAKEIRELRGDLATVMVLVLTHVGNVSRVEAENWVRMHLITPSRDRDAKD